MSNDVTTQLADYFAYVDEAQGAVDLSAALKTEPMRLRSIETEPSRQRPWRPVWMAAVAALVTLALVGGAALLFSREGDTTPVVTQLPSPSTTLLPATTLPPPVVTTTPPTTVITREDRGILPTHTIAQPGGWMAGLSIYEDTLWALVQMPASSTDIDESTLFEGQILRIDPDTGEVLSRIDIGEALLWDPAIEAGAGAVWAVWGNMLLRIDPTGETVETVIDTLVTGQDDPLGNDVYGRLAVGEGAVWLLDDESSLIRIDPTTNTATGTIELEGDPWSLEVGAGSVWVLIGEEPTPADDPNTRYGRLLRIDPETLEVTPTARISDVLLTGFGRPLAFGEDALWVTNQGAVTRITPDSGAITASIAVPGSGCGPLAIGFGDGKVWTSFSGAWLTAIDPTTNTATAAVWIREPARGGGSVFNIAGTGDALWITRMTTLLQRLSMADITPGVAGAPEPCT
jgi:hypothetical protein